MVLDGKITKGQRSDYIEKDPEQLEIGKKII